MERDLILLVLTTTVFLLEGVIYKSYWVLNSLMFILIVQCKNSLNVSLQIVLIMIEILSHQKGYLLSNLIVTKMLNTSVYQLKVYTTNTS